MSCLLTKPGRFGLSAIALALSIDASAQVTLNVAQGWNLLGNSSASAIDVTKVFNDTTKFSTIWVWNAASSKWAFYAPSLVGQALTDYANSKGYDVLSSIAPKNGFWVNAKLPATVTGPVADGVTLLEGDMQAGWNLMSSADKLTPSELNKALGASMGAAGKSMTTAWAWDANSSAWRFFAPSLEAKGGTALSDYISGKQYLAFTSALSEADGFWLNIATTPPSASTAFVEAPVVNTPVDGATVTLTCASGAIGGRSTAAQGKANIAVDSATCLPPYTLAVTGKGKMAGPDLKFGTADDETYDSSTRAALKSVIQSTDLGLQAGAAPAGGAKVTAPAITALTTMVAEAVAKPNPTPQEISAAIANVQNVAGLTDPTLVYANPLTNGAVFNAATLVNELVANAVTADPTQAPNILMRNMALNATSAKLTDATIDPAKLMGASSTSATVLQAQMATMQAKAEAMKSVADAIKTAAGSTANVMPADALAALNTALAGTSASAAQQAIAQAQLAQDTMKQMMTQMATMQADATIPATDLPTKMAAMMTGLESVRATQDTSLQSAINAAGTDPAKIAAAIQSANLTAQSMIVASGASLFSTVANTAAGNLTSTYMSALAGSVTQQLSTAFANVDPATLAAATSGASPANLTQALAGVGVAFDPATIAQSAQTTAGSVSSLSTPSALANFPALGEQVVGMVLARAGNFNWMSSTQLQAWVDAIGTAFAKNDIALLNPASVGYTLSNYFATSQPDLSKAPAALTLTIMSIGAASTNGALPLCSTLTGTGTTANAGVNCTANPTASGGGLPLCSALPAGIQAVTSGSSQNCVTSTTGGTLPSCFAIASTGTTPTVQICTADTTASCSTLPQNMQFPGLTCTSSGTGTLPSCSTMGTSAQPGVNCTAVTSGGGATLPLCSTLGSTAVPGTNCLPDPTGSGTTTGGLPDRATFCSSHGYQNGFVIPNTSPYYVGETCPLT